MAVLLDLGIPRLRRTPVADRRGEDREIGRSAASTAASIARALSTRTTATPAGSGMVTGPETSVTRAPAAAAAAATAWPWRPEERLAR